MPLMTLSCTAIDLAEGRREATLEELLATLEELLATLEELLAS